MILATELSAELFVDGRRRGQRAGEDLEWLAVDVEDLTFEDERFNYIVSSLGVQFAPRHEVLPRSSYASSRPRASTSSSWT